MGEPPPDPPHPHAMMTSQEVDTIVYSYLKESGYTHTSFSLLHESPLLHNSGSSPSALNSPTTPGGSSSGQMNGRKHRREDSTGGIMNQVVPPGHLVRILQKGLLYLEAEARYRGDPVEPPPRLIGYSIPNALPLPPLPKALPSATPPPPPTTSVPPQTNGTTAQPIASTSTLPAATPAPPAVSAKGKGKEKATEAPAPQPTNKRKARAGSDRDDLSTEGGKRPRTASGEKKRKTTGLGSTGTMGGNGLREKSGRKASGNYSAASAIAANPGNTAGENTEDSTMDASPGGSPPPPPPPPIASTSSAPPPPPPSSLSSTQNQPVSAAMEMRRSTSKQKSSVASASRGSASPITKVLPLPKAGSPAPSSTRSVHGGTPPPATGTRGTPPPPVSTRRTSPVVERRRPSGDQIAKIKSEGEEASKERFEALESSLNPSAPEGDGLEEGEVASKETDRDGDGDVQMEEEKLEKRVEKARINFDSVHEKVLVLRGHTIAKVQPCSWNPKVSGLLATGGGDSTCRIWDVPSSPRPGSNGEQTVVTDNIVCKHSSAQRRCDISAVAWNPSGSLLATGSEDGIARIWTPSGDLHLVLSMHQRQIFSLKWNSLGTMLLTCSNDSSVCLWEVVSGKVRQQWQTHMDAVLDIDWNDDQSFASGSSDNQVHLFHIGRTAPIHRFKSHKDDVNALRFSPCRTLLASCSDDHTIRIWSLKGISGLNEERDRWAKEDGRLIDEPLRGGNFVLEGHKGEVHTITWAPQNGDGPRLLASGSFDFTTRLWNADTGDCLHTFADSDYIYGVAFNFLSSARFLSTGSNDGAVVVWNIDTKEKLLEYRHAGPVYEIVWNSSGTQLVVCGRAEDVAVVAFEP